MTNALIPTSWNDPATAVPKGWIKDAEAIAKERAEAILLVSERRYLRAGQAHAEASALGLYQFGAQIRRAPGNELRFHVVIEGGRKPEVLLRHLSRIAPGYQFFAAVEKPAPDEPETASD